MKQGMGAVLAGFAGGALVGVASVLLTGIMSIQAIGLRAGADIGLNNEVVAVGSPRTPWLPMIAMAALGGLTLYLIYAVLRRSHAQGIALAIGFSSAALVLCIWALSTAKPGIFDANGSALPHGAEGWLQQGGLSPAIHLAIVLALGLVAIAWRSGNRQVGSVATPSEPVQPVSTAGADG